MRLLLTLAGLVITSMLPRVLVFALLTSISNAITLQPSPVTSVSRGRAEGSTPFVKGSLCDNPNGRLHLFCVNQRDLP
jgi:hypothetical protein